MLTFTRLNEIAARLWNTGWAYGGWFLFANVAWFIVITALATVWSPTLIAGLAFIVPLLVALRFLMRYVWWPTGPIAIGMNEFFQRFTKLDLGRFVLWTIALQIGWGLFVAYWPIEESPSLLVPFIGAVIAAVLFGALSRGKKGFARMLSGAFALAAIVLLLLFIPEVRAEVQGSIDEIGSGGQTTGTVADGGEIRYSVTLRGENTPSDVVLTLGDGTRPPGTWCSYFGPPGSRLLFDDGSTLSVTGESTDGKIGPITMLGPAGETAGARCRLP